LQRRLTIAILAVVLGTLVLTVGASVLLVQRAAISTGEGQLTPEAQALGEVMSIRTLSADSTIAKALRQIGGFDLVQVVGVGPQGSFSAIPSPLSAGLLNARALNAGDTVSGNVGHTVFAAVPLSLTASQQVRLGIPARDQPILVVARRVKNPVNGVSYFLLVAGAVLVIGALVAAVLARRISAPLVEAVNATSRIAKGDLSARVPVHKNDYPELK
jgi:hypothetical protein